MSYLSTYKKPLLNLAQAKHKVMDLVTASDYSIKEIEKKLNELRLKSIKLNNDQELKKATDFFNLKYTYKKFVHSYFKKQIIEFDHFKNSNQNNKTTNASDNEDDHDEKY